MAGSSAPPPVQLGQGPGHRQRDGRRTQAGHRDAAARVHQRGDGVGQHDGGVGQQPAPVARVIAALARSDSSKFTAPREPANNVGRSACRRGPSLARKTSAASSSRRASQKAARPGEPASSPVSISQTALKPSLPPRAAMAWRSAAGLMLCWPLLSAVPRPYQRSPSTRSVQGSRPASQRAALPRTTSPCPYSSTVGRAGSSMRRATRMGRSAPAGLSWMRQAKPSRPAAAPCRRADRRAARPPGRLPRSRSGTPRGGPDRPGRCRRRTLRRPA